MQTEEQEREAYVIRSYCARKGGGLPTHTVFVQRDDHAVRWDHVTGEVRTIYGEVAEPG